MRKLIIAILCAAAPAASFAGQWQILGTRPMGMGGAFVAVAQGPVAQYWNPAGLVKSSANVSGMEIPVDVSAEFTGDIAKNASQIGDLAKTYQATQSAQQTRGAMNADQAAAFVKTLSLLSDMNKPGKGALLDVAGGVDFKFSKVALSVNNFTSIGLNPFVDTTNVGLGTIGGSGSTGIDMSGVTATAPVGDPTLAAAATNIGTAIQTIGYGNLEKLICASAGCLNGQTSGAITGYATLANAFVNQAHNSGLSDAQIVQAANTMTQYAGSVAPIIANVVAHPGADYSNNTSNLNAVGASFTEIAAGYAWNLKMLRGLSLGANLKMVNGQIAETTFHFLSNSNTNDAFKMNDIKSTWQPSADLGLLWDMNQKYPKLPLHPRLGLVVRDINNPKFDTAFDGQYTLKRQARMGLALNPAKFWTLAMDMDLSKNNTNVEGFDSRDLSMGTEINIVNRKAFNIPLRGGLIKNLAEKDSKVAYTLGTGINLLYMHLDVSAVASSDKTEIDGHTYPTKVGLAASFGLLF